MSDIILSVDGDLRPLESKLNRISSKNISLNLRDSLSQPLGRITGKVSEFEKSLEASNARVLAFGASAGAVYAVQRAFSDIVKSTIEVEKSLTDINVVLNASTKDLGKFGKELFSIAKNTGQGFDQVAKAATEFARQGLGVAETLKRTNDALILSRLSGLDAARSVETLTAAVNSFARAGLTSTQIINKLANVDAAFAVSTADLAEAISRVGSTAQDVGVDFDQLIAIVTAAQQTTARGGAVIGNSFKTIFTRLQRTDTLDELENLGIAVRDLQGNTLPAVQILKNLSDVFYTLSDSQRASAAETVGGVFQINILRAALSDLSKEYSIYNGALNIARASTDQAIQRNEALNQTLAALTNKTFVNLKEAAARIGEITIAPTLKTGLGGLNAILGEFNKPEEAQGIGTKIATGLLKGIGSYLGGPGLAIIGVAFIKIFGGLTKFSAEALKSLIGIASSADKIAAAQARVNAILAQNPGLIQAVISKDASLLQIENQILKIIQQQNAARAVGATISARAAPLVAAVPTPKVKTKSAGYIPNFVSPTMQEKIGAFAGGYTPGAVKKMGGMYYNTAESVVQFPGADGPAIMPPQNSLAGENYRSSFKKQVGFDPYAYRGYVPNFADKERKKYTKIVDTGRQNKVGMIFPYKTNKAVDAFGYAKYGDYKIKVGFPMSGYNPANIRKPADIDLIKQLGDNIITFTNEFAKKLFQGSGQMPQITNISQLSNAGSFGSIAGAVFESAVGLATSNLNEGRGQNAPIDFSAPSLELRKLFNMGVDRAATFEAKVNPKPDQRDSVAQKILNLGYIGAKTKEILGEGYTKELKDRKLKEKELAARKAAEKGILLTKGKISSARRTRSFGYIPNFAALQDAIAREQAAGVNPNLIRVGTNSSLMSRNNPLGLGVYNTRDEPAGLQQGVNRYSGVIPNYASKAFDPAYRAKVTGAGNVDKTTINNINLAGKAAGNFADKINENQGKLVALGVGLSLLQGQLSQFGDANNKFIQGLNQMTIAASSVTTAFGAFGGGPKGYAAAGTMLAIQGAAGLSANANKPLNAEIEALNKRMEKAKESSSQLEASISKLTPTLNDYAAELEKADPDPEAIAKFKKAILEGMSDLGPELQKMIIENISSPQDVMGGLSKEQRKKSVEQTQIGLGQLVKSEEARSRANMGWKGQAGQMLMGTGVPLLAQYGQSLVAGEKKPMFQSEESISAAAGAIIAPLRQTPEDLLLLADTLATTSGSTAELMASLEALTIGAGGSTEELVLLKNALATNPDAAQKLTDELKNMAKGLLEAQAAAAAAGKQQEPKAPGYKGISKLYGREMYTGGETPTDRLNQQLQKVAIMRKKIKGKENNPILGRILRKEEGEAALRYKEAGQESPEEFRKSLDISYGEQVQRREKQQADLEKIAGVDSGAAERVKTTDYTALGVTGGAELYGEAGKDLPSRNKMTNEVPVIPETDEQRKNRELEAASRKATKDLETASGKPVTADLIKPTIDEQMPIPPMSFENIANSAMLLGGTALALPAVARGVSTVAGGAANVGKNVIGGAANVGKNVIGGAARGVSTVAGGASNLFTAGRVGLNSAAAANGFNIPAAQAFGMSPLVTTALGVSAFAGGAALGYTAGEAFDPGAEKRTAMLESIPGVQDGFKLLSSSLPSWLGGGGGEELSPEEQAANMKKFEELKARALEKQQAVEQAPKAEAPQTQVEEAAKTAKAEQAEPTQVNNNISVSPNINIAQKEALDKAELQKMIEEEVKKFGEAIFKIAEDKAKAREKGVVNPPQRLSLTA